VFLACHLRTAEPPSKPSLKVVRVARGRPICEPLGLIVPAIRGNPLCERTSRLYAPSRRMKWVWGGRGA
jgi:hypothetical protein